MDLYNSICELMDKMEDKVFDFYDFLEDIRWKGNKYKDLSLDELSKLRWNVQPGKEARMLYRAVKRHWCWYKVPFFKRHPMLVQMAIIIFDVSIAVPTTIFLAKLLGLI